MDRRTAIKAAAETASSWWNSLTWQFVAALMIAFILKHECGWLGYCGAAAAFLLGANQSRGSSVLIVTAREVRQ